jgi:glycosyltransferase involved in cell wall biosynthesis
MTDRARLLIFIVAYNAERTIEEVLRRIPAKLAADYELEVLIIDDASQDRTFERGQSAPDGQALPFELHVLFNPVNQGYRGNRLHDLDDPNLPVNPAEFDFVLLLDVLEHLDRPEEFVDRLRNALASSLDTRLVVSTGNIGFALTRLLLLFGQFNYGKRGILDLTHTRLFTFSTILRLLHGASFEPVLVRGVPAPFPLALRSPRAGRSLLKLNETLIRVRKQVFSYQAFVVARPRPSLESLLSDAERASNVRASVPAA